MKRFLAIFLLITILLGGSGCTMNPTQTTESTESGGKEVTVNKNTARILHHLEEKYGEPFFYVGPTGDSMSGTHSFFVGCDSMPGEEIKVSIDHYNKEDELIRDNYLLFKYHNEIYDMLLRGLQTEFGDVVLYYLPGVSVPRANLPADASLDDLLDDSGIIISASAEVRASRLNSLEQAENALLCITTRGCRYYFSLISVEEEQFGKLSYEELSNGALAGEYEHFAVFVKGDGGVQTSWD